jgi:hypothetical protein
MQFLIFEDNGNQPIACVEIKLSTSPKVSRGFYEVINDLKTNQNFVIMPSGDAFPIQENVHCYNLTEFVQKIIPAFVHLFDFLRLLNH